MKGLSTILSQRVESLLPRTDAAACFAYQTWLSFRGSCSPATGWGYISAAECHDSCFGKTVCGAWGLYEIETC
jgi:hypothetical protein